MRRAASPTQPTRRGFAIADSIALFAVAGSAAAIFPAAIGSSRISSQRSQNAANHRLLGQAQGLYMAENQDEYAGVNTSGAAYQGVGVSLDIGAVDFSDALRGDTNSTTPTSSWDWISPILGDKGRFSPNRAQRLSDILNRLAPPEARRTNDYVFIGDAAEPEITEFESAFAAGVPQVNYLQPISFHLYSPAADNDFVPEVGPPGGDFVYRTSLRRGFNGTPAITPAEFRPVLDRVGTSPSAKVMHADGTRFVDSEGLVSVTASVDSQVNGNFGTLGPILDGSNAYGRSATGAPWNLDLTYRADNGIHTTMFDGAVRFMTREESWTDPAPWYPGGSIFTGQGATPESIEFADTNYKGVLP